MPDVASRLPSSTSRIRNQLFSFWTRVVASEKSLAKRYLFAALATFIAFGLTRLIEAAGWGATSAILFGAAILSAIYGGLWLGAMSAVVSSILLEFFVVEPIKGGFSEPVSFVRLLIYLCITILISSLVATLARLFRSSTQAHEDKDLLLAIVTHDLKNPLWAILAGSDLMGRMLRGSPESVPREQIQKLSALVQGTYEAAEVMSRLIQDLQDAHAIDEGKLSIAKEDVSLESVLGDIDRSFREIAENKRIQFIVKLHPGLPLISVDRFRIFQALGNVIGNAIKFTDSGGLVRVEAKQVGLSQVEILIQDTGAGIPPEGMPHLFDRYWKLAKKGAKSRGLGLGLFITRSIVDLHGGQIKVSSESGRGTEVRIYLSPKLALQKAA